MLLPLQVPKEYYDVVNVEDRWDMTNPQREIVDLSKHWGKLSLEHCSKWQRDFNGYFSLLCNVCFNMSQLCVKITAALLLIFLIVSWISVNVCVVIF